MDKITKFIYELTKDVPHQNKTFFEHLYGTSKIIESKFPDKKYLINAGLYHAVYGTFYFSFDSNIPRETIQDLIGKKSESLVYLYCNLENRIDKILEHKFEHDLQKDLYILEYANLLDQYELLDDINIKDIETIKQRLLNYYGIDMENNSSLNDQLYVFDGKLSRSELAHLHGYCLDSRYKLEQYSDICSHQRDMRFSCHLTRDEFKNTRVLSAVESIVESLNIKLYLREYYINHYSQISYVSRHTDANVNDCVTILVFCNKYWDETWGGELKIYDDENDLIHKVVDFVPGRIVIFDSKIEHKVLPLSPLAKSDRFSLAIKGYTNRNYLTEFDNDFLIEVGVAK